MISKGQQFREASAPSDTRINPLYAPPTRVIPNYEMLGCFSVVFVPPWKQIETVHLLDLACIWTYLVYKFITV